MNFSNKPLVYLALTTLAGLIFANVWAFQDYIEKKSEFQAAADRFAESQEKIEEIRRLENQPRKASQKKETPAEIIQRASKASEAAGIVGQNVWSDELKAENSRYSSRTSHVTFEALTLPQIINFCQSIEDAEAGLTVREIDLTPSLRPNAGQELWSVNLTLTQLIFSPKSLVGQR